MPTPYAAEFTDEMGPQYEASILNKINEGESDALGRVSANRQSGGLDADASAGAERGAIEAGATSARAGAVGQFNMDVANKRYSERMTDEARSFQDIERQKDEEFRKQLAIMGYEHENAVNAGNLHAAERGQLIGGLFGLANPLGASAGQWTASGGGAAAAGGGAAGAGGLMAGGGEASSIADAAVIA